MFYVEGGRAVIQVEFRDQNGDLYDPTSVDSVEIYDSSGTLITTISTGIINSSTGIYYIVYTIPASPDYGWWRANFYGTTDSKDDIVEIQFEVVLWKKLYTSIDRVYSKGGITSEVIPRDDVKEKIREAMADIDSEMQRRFDEVQTITEWHNITPADDYVDQKTIFTDYRPIVAVSLLEDYENGTVQKTYTSDEYFIDNDTGIVELYSKYNFTHGNRAVKITYTYGYARVPKLIDRLCTILTAKAILIEQVGGTYETPSMYSVAGLSVSIGQAYVNIRGAIDVLVKEEAEVRKALGKLRTTILAM